MISNKGKENDKKHTNKFSFHVNTLIRGKLWRQFDESMLCQLPVSENFRMKFIFHVVWTALPFLWLKVSLPIFT